MLKRYLTTEHVDVATTLRLIEDPDLHQMNFDEMDRSSTRLSDQQRANTSRPSRAGGSTTRLRRIKSFACINNDDSKKLPTLSKRGSCDCTPRSAGSDRWSESTDFDLRSESTNRTAPPNGIRQAWSLFTEHVKCIDVNTLHFRDKKLTPKSSNDFREVLTKMRSEHEKSEKKITPTNWARASTLSTQHQYHVNTPRSQSLSISIDNNPAKEDIPTIATSEETGDKEDVEEPSDNEAAEDEANGVKRHLPRGWSIMRRGIHEQVLEHRKAHTVVGWNLLQHTIDQMTDAERARQTLYDRYLYDPDPDAWASGLINYPRFLLDRRQRAAAGRKRPFSSAPTAGRPPRSRLTSAVHRSGKTPSRATKKPPGERPRSTQSLPNRPRETNSSLLQR